MKNFKTYNFKKIKLILILLIAIGFVISFHSKSEAACDCAITGPGQYPVVSQTPPGVPLDKVVFNIISPYTFGAMTAPIDWTVVLSNGNRTATFSTSRNAARIQPNKCLTFTLNVTDYSGDITLLLSSVTAYDTKSNTEYQLNTNFAQLAATIVATPSTSPNGGLISVTMNIQNNGSASASVTPSSLTLNNPGLASLTSGPLPSSLTIAPGTSGSFTWTYTAAGAPASGSLTFSGSASDVNNCYYSQWVTSNVVAISALAATLSVTPDTTTSGANVTVTMNVTNYSANTLLFVYPSVLTTLGTSTETLVSGPTPAFQWFLPSGNSVTFQWTYRITGTAGQTYAFQGNALSFSGLTSNTATSNTGIIFACSAYPSPVVDNGDGTYIVTWTLRNNSGTGVNRIDFTIPWPWIPSSASTALGTVASIISPTSTSSGLVSINPASLPAGASGTVSITFSSTPASGIYSFPVNMLGGGCGSPVNTLVTAPTHQNTLVLNALTTGTASSHTITATLCSASSQSGNVNFTATNGTLPSSVPITTTGCSPCTGCPSGTIQSGEIEPVTVSCNSYSTVSSTVTGSFSSTTGSVSVSLKCGIKSTLWHEIQR